MGVKNSVRTVVVLLLFAALLSVFKLAGLATDFLWFDSLGFSQIFLVSLQAKVFLFFFGSVVFFAFAAVNLYVSSRLHQSLVSFRHKALIVAVLSFIFGLSSASAWLVVLQYLNQVSFGLFDPIFKKNVAFYVFSLPLYLSVWKFAFACVIVTIILVSLDYLYNFLAGLFRPQYEPGNVRRVFDYKSELVKIKRKALVHLALLGSLVFVLFSVKHYLARFAVMYSEKGIVVGAGYTDVFVFLPIAKLMVVLALVVAILFYLWIFYVSRKPGLKKRHLLLYAITLYVMFVFFVPTVVPALVQSFRVTPNEINLEKPYIENNIRFTKIAYGLSDVEEKDFPVEMMLTSRVLEDAKETIDNVRLLDWRPLTQTYKQTQEIRLYYDLSGIDIDRYMIDGKYTEVMISPRELDQRQITENAKTWVNLHMVYTHGYGMVMSPVNSVTEEGLPDFFIKDIPPVYTVQEEGLKISRPQLYHGQLANSYVLVNTKTAEFDYPKGNTNEYINYDGSGGVLLDSFFRKLLMALRFRDVKILLSTDITSDSRIMFERNIQGRILKITPFLTLDYDPYVVIDNGIIYWVQDAYTTTGYFPYSAKYKNINYIRNSVKVVVNAYDGDVTYYVADRSDPLILTYSRIFPGSFRPLDAMPAGLKKHLRYPEDLFKVQSAIYSTYHMNDPTVFYNKEDAWQIPLEIYGTGQQVAVEPYYVIMKLPGEETAEFVLMISFTPIKKDNMVAWLAGRSDGKEYGKLVLFQFPKDKLIYGPSQIEAKFDQDSDISEQLTLWSQQGSQVARGNLLVIPIEDSILYVEPLYIQAERGQLPQLKRVLASDGDRVVMEKDLASALAALFGKPKAAAPTTEVSSTEELIVEANQLYEEILGSMQVGNWSGIGTNLDRLGKVLESLKD